MNLRKNRVVERSFQASWFQKWKWLLYDESNDLVFRHKCMKASSGIIEVSIAGACFYYSRVFNNWKMRQCCFANKKRLDVKKMLHRQSLLYPKMPLMQVKCIASYILLQTHVSKNAFRCNLRASIFQNFPWGHASRPPSRSMLSALHTIQLYVSSSLTFC